MFPKRFEEPLDAISELQTKLTEISDVTIDSIINRIKTLDHFFLIDQYCLRRLLLAINSSISSTPHQLLEYLKIFNFLKDKIRQFFSSDELFTLFKENKSALLFLSDLNLLNISSLLMLDIHNEDLLFYFAPEIIKSIKNKRTRFSASKFQTYLYENLNINEHIERRAKLVNPDLIPDAIHDDNLELFQDIISQSNIESLSDISIQYSFFEPINFINKMIKYELLSLIEYASFFGSINIVKYLIGNEVDLTKFRGRFAIAGGNAEIIHILEEKNVNFNSLDCLAVAIQFHHFDIIRYLHETNEVKYEIKLIETCVRYDNISTLKEILDEIVIHDGDQQIFISSIEIATKAGNIDLILYLINQMNQLNFKIDEITLISFLNTACQFGYLDIIQYLINEMHVPYTSDKFKGLYDASEKGHFAIVQYLCSLPGINLNYQYQVSTDTPLTISAYRGHFDIVKFLYNLKGVDVNHQLYNYRTAVFRAAEGQHFDILVFLYENATNSSEIINKVDMNGWNLLNVASQYDCVEIIKYLVEEKGFDVNLPNSRQLFNVIQCNCVDSLKYLLSLDNFKIFSEENGQTAIHIAAFYMIKDVLKLLIDSKRIDINAKDKSGVINFFFFLTQPHYFLQLEVVTWK